MSRGAQGARGILMAAAACAVCAAGLPLAAAQSIPVPLAPDNPAVADQWVNSQVRLGEGTHGVSISLMSAPSTAPSREPIRVKVRVHNEGSEPATGLTLTPRRGPVSGSLTDARAATVAQVGEYAIAGEQVTVPSIPAGGDVEVEVTFSAEEHPTTVTRPVMVVAENAGAIVDTERWHMTVKGTGQGSAQGTPGVDELERTPAGMSVLYPITAPVDIVPGETGEAPNRPPLILESEQLAGQIAPGGRLDQLVDIYAELGAGDETCMAVDPALLDTVARMADGYTVNDDRPAPAEKRQRLRDSWGSSDSGAGSTPGTGADDAAAWLEKIQAAAKDKCVLAMPWANTDLEAVARTGNSWLMREAVERGTFTAERVLNTPITRNVVLPGAGYVTDESLAGMGWADHSQSTVPEVGMQTAWEKTQKSNSSETADRAPDGRVEGEQRSTLDDPAMPNAAGIAATQPAETVRVLVANNTTNVNSAHSRFTDLQPGVVSVGFDYQLASILATTGPNPETTGFSDDHLRFDYTRDSEVARNTTAATAVRTLAHSHVVVGESAEAPEPVLVAPPAAWEPTTARAVMETVSELFRERTSVPMSLEDYMRLPADPAQLIAGAPSLLEADPTVYSDTEVLNASQQGAFIDDLTALLGSDPAIALTQYGYTLPLRQDLLNALTMTGRRSYTGYMEAQQRTRERLNGNRDALAGLRAAINLIPPGNVYTRASESSPLLIVAENGLPLPVDASILYNGPAGAHLNTPAEFRIPARGSLTLQMTADLEDREDQTKLQLYLATPKGQPISQPVDIAVQTAGGAVQNWIIIAGASALFVLALMFQRGKRRGAQRGTRGVQAVAQEG